MAVALALPPPIEEWGQRRRHHRPELEAAWTEQVTAAKEQPAGQRLRQLQPERRRQTRNLNLLGPEQPRCQSLVPVHPPSLGLEWTSAAHLRTTEYQHPHQLDLILKACPHALQQPAFRHRPKGQRLPVLQQGQRQWRRPGLGMELRLGQVREPTRPFAAARQLQLVPVWTQAQQ